jgi:tetratricopeptide (TPR) repeat protein
VRRDLYKRVAGGVFALAVIAGAATSATVGCSGWDPSEPFERNAPEVDEAIGELDAGQIEKAEDVLEQYLGTGPCTDAGIGLPDAVRQKPNGSFDLGLTLFYMAERYGRRFGEEELGAGETEDPQQIENRRLEIECAMIVVKAIASDPSVPLELRARAHYLAGNLEFLRKKYEDAVKQYDEALKIVPGILEEAGGDGIGRDAAWNRAIALRRIEEQRDAGDDGADGSDGADGADGDDGADGSDAEDATPDTGPDAPDGDSGEDGGGDAGDQPDGSDDGGEGDGGPRDAASDAPGDAAPADSGSQGPEPKPDPRGEPELQPEQKQDDRILDQLEEAPTYQEQEAKNRASTRRGRAMEDK